MKLIKKIHRQAGSTDSKILILLFGISLLGVGVFAGVTQQRNQTGQQSNSQPVISTTPEEVSPKLESPNTLIYGVWEGDNSLIKAYDLETKNSVVVAELPQNIKRVTVKTPNSLYFINDTNNVDHGKTIVRAKFGAAQETLVTADPGFGIDDYYLSKDGNFMTTWEVSLGKGSDVLYGGNSRVYSINLSNPTVKNLIYDEVADKPIHYPRGITNSGTVVTDMFLPNSGPGWGYGMSTSDTTGSMKLDSPDMANGTYGRQPRMSDDGTMLSFSGYDGTRGSGTEQMQGIRKAIILPNTVEIVDTTTLQRRKLPNISNKYIYDNTRVDKDGKHLLIGQIKYINNEYKPYVLVYDLEKNTATQVPNSRDKRGFAVLSDTQVFVSTPNVSGQTLGNLGETYQFLNSEFGIINPKDGKSATLQIADNNMQFIGLFPNSEINLSAVSGSSNAEVNRDAMQMHSFVLKTNLLPNRRNLQARSRADNSKTSAPKTLGIKVIAQRVNPVAPIIPEGFTPPPGQTIPEGARRPEDPLGENPINGNPAGGNPPAAANPPENQPANQPSMGAAEVVANPSGAAGIPAEIGGGEIPNDPEGLIRLIQQLLGILEEESQN